MLDNQLATPVTAPALVSADVPEKRKHSRAKGQERQIPTDLVSLRIYLMHEMGQTRPDRQLLRLGERLLRSFDKEERITTAGSDKDAEIQRLQQELDATRERTLDSSVIRDYKNRKDTLEREITTLKSENVGLKTQVAAIGSLSTENERLREAVSRIHAVLKSKTDDLWGDIQRRVNEATTLQDFEKVDSLTVTSKEIEELMSVCVKSSETRSHVA